MKNKYIVLPVYDKYGTILTYTVDNYDTAKLSRSDARLACKYLNDLDKAKQQAKKDKEYNNSWKHTRDMCS
ncbi:MAG: hypothetical protein M0R17_02805 [Candidatus Omnitrophica bacterium]|jgi:hypothetical protein|nr:hypothetical protein [Candidatus Omnitrophota bacterium]